MNLIFIANILQHLSEVTGKILDIDDRADYTTLALETDGITLVEIDLHVATLITGNTALVTTAVVDKDVLTLVTTCGTMIGGAQVVTTEGIKLDETEKTGGTTCVETGGKTVVTTDETTIDGGTLGRVDEYEAVALAVDVAVAVDVPVARVPEIKTIKNQE